MKYLWFLVVALAGGVAGFVLASSRNAAPAPTGLEPSAVYARAAGATVTVRASNASLNTEDVKGYGTAFHIGDGYYVTAAHVVADGYKFFLDRGARTVERTEDNAGITPVQVIGKDAASDLALLKGDPAPAVLTWATRAPTIGEPAYAIGNPFARAPSSFTHGIVSGLGRVFPTERGTLTGMLQMDTPVNPGNSGGPLLNAAGEVIGVVSAILAPGGQSAGVGFAVPAARASSIIAALRERGKVTHPALGVVGSTEGEARLTAVQPGGIAARAGLRAGDVVLRVAGLEVDNFEELTALIAGQNPEATVDVTVRRGTETQTVSVKLGAQ